MGLRKPTTDAATSNVPSFEDEDTAAAAATVEVGSEGVTTSEINTNEAAAAAATAAAARAESPAPAAVTQPPAGAAAAALVPAEKKSLAAILGSKYQPALQEFKDVIDPRGIEFDAFPRVTVGLDGFSDDKEHDLGKQIGLEMMSWNERYIVTAGDDSDEANALTRYPLDGKMLDDGSMSCEDYVKVLKQTHGYENADVKRYYAIYGFLCATSAGGKLEAIDEVARDIVSIQIPPRSVSKFQAHQVQDGMKVSRGLLEASPYLLLQQEKVKGKSRAYALITFGRLPAGVLA